MGLTDLREKKTYTDKTKLNPAACDDTLRSKDKKRSVCARNFPVAQMVEHGASNATIMGSIPRESKS